MNNWRHPAVRLLAGAAVLVAVVAVIGPGPFVAGARAVDVSLLALGALLGVPATLACAWRWRLIAAALGVPVDPVRAVLACYAAQLVNVIVPTGVAGDVHRGLTQAPAGRRLVGLRAVAWERASGQAVQIVAALVMLAVLPSPLRTAAWWAVLGVVGLFVGLLLLGRRCRSAVRRLRADLAALAAARVVPGVVATSLVAQASYVGTGLLAARAVGVSAPLTTLVPLIVVMLVAMAIPLSVLGWGPREGVAAGAFASVGLGADAGVATAVAYGLIATVAASPGAPALVLVTSGSWRRRSEVKVATPTMEEITHG